MTVALAIPEWTVWGGFAASIVVVATPLLLAATGEWVSERAGVLNVAVEGAMLAACYAAFAATLASGDPLVGLAAAVVAGALCSAIVGWLAIRLGADAVIAGTALNLLALGATELLFRRHMESTPGTALVEPLPAVLLPLVAWLAIPVLAWTMARTRLGLRLRASGENANAAATHGVSVRALRMGAVVFGGVFAGLAGAQLALVEARTFVEGMTGGRGYLALAIVVCGRWRAGGVLLAALLFGGAIVLQFRFQAGGTRLPYPVFLMLPYLLTLGVLAVLSGRSRAPADLNRPFG